MAITFRQVRATVIVEIDDGARDVSGLKDRLKRALFPVATIEAHTTVSGKSEIFLFCDSVPYADVILVEATKIVEAGQ